MGKIILVEEGSKYGRLLFLKRTVGAKGMFMCDCGKEKEIRVMNVTKGTTRSCGCLNSELSSARVAKFNTTHGLSDSPLRYILSSMKSRCYNERHKQYKDYGGRGIKIHSEWANSLESFYNWCMVSGYKKGLHIDRINNDGNYEPENCRFVSGAVNQNNKRNTISVEFNGSMIKFNDLLKLTGMNKSTLYGRIFKYGLTANEAVSASRYQIRSYNLKQNA